MQNRYTGDIGDFGKLGLLRFLQMSGLSVGVNWYLVPDENHNSDGRYIHYLKDDFYRCLDEPLWLELKRIVEEENRNVSALETDRVLKATFYDNLLDFSGKTKADRLITRNVWHEKAVKKLSQCDIVFVDPDNGILVPSAKDTTKENKFVKPEELIDYYSQGLSVIYYQHKARRPDAFYLNQHNQIMSMINNSGAFGLGLKFVKTSQRYFFFILQSSHRCLIVDAIRKMIASEWNNCFKVYT